MTEWLGPATCAAVSGIQRGGGGAAVGMMGAGARASYPLTPFLATEDLLIGADDQLLQALAGDEPLPGEAAGDTALCCVTKRPATPERQGTGPVAFDDARVGGQRQSGVTQQLSQLFGHPE